MGIRLPLTTVLDYNDIGNVGATSVVSKTFMLPQDNGNIVIKVPQASINGTNPTVDVYLQTTDDGGVTWYDLAHLPTITGTIANAGALWASVPVEGYGVKTTTLVAANSSIFGSIMAVTGNASMRGTPAGAYTGLPVLARYGQVQISYGGTIAANNNLEVKVIVNSDASTD